MSALVFVLVPRVEATLLGFAGDEPITEWWSLIMLANSSWLLMACFSPA